MIISERTKIHEFIEYRHGWTSLSSPASMFRLCITDDHPLILEGLRMVLHDHQSVEVVRLCKSGEELLAYLGAGDLPDIILLDINMPGLNGIETCQRVKKEFPVVKVIGLSMIAESHLVKLMIRNGAEGYLHKNAGTDEILDAIQSVMQGKTYLSEEIASAMIRTETPKVHNSPYPKLSSREKEILAMIIDEKTTQEISDKLYISFSTVETHRRNIMMKLGVKNTAGLVRIALEYHLI